MNRVVIVGASAGGLATAVALRVEGYDGGITLVGDEADAPYDRPPLSKEFLSEPWEPDRLTLLAATDLDTLDLELRLGTPATALSTAAREVTLADGSAVAYDALVVATGVRPRVLPDRRDGVHVLRTVADALPLRERLAPGRRLVIVGAGFVGTEVAATARARGVEVTMLESAAAPLAHEIGEAAGRFLAELHREHGVELRTDAAVTGITEDGVRLDDGTEVEGDDVLLAVGSEPNTEWLTAEDLKIHNGLVCDEFCAAAPDVYGVGDVARWYNPLFGTEMRVEHRRNASEQAAAVARNLLEPDARTPFAPVPYFWSDQYDVKIQAYGHLREHEDAVIVYGDVAARRLLVAYRNEDRLTGVLAVGQSSRALRSWRALIAARCTWRAALAIA
jgi:NADPH-dependent 2,4-dienoyl-CoA reductase/sulfur reductase-like enzyme